MSESVISGDAVLPEKTECIDCTTGIAVPAFARIPKEANFATPLPGRWTGAAPRIGDSYVIYRCTECGSTFLHPVYFDEADACYRTRRYFEGYYPHNIHTGGHPSDEEHKFPKLKEKMEQRRVKWLLHLVRRHWPKLPATPSFCDIGCANGWLVWAALSNGLDAYGVEVSPQALRAKERCGDSRIHHGYLDDQCLEGRAFDVIVLMQTAEHIQNLGSVLEIIRRRLTPNGVLVIVSPNDLGGYRPLFWRRYWWFIPPMHVRYFSVPSLGRLLERHGLRVLGNSTTGSFGGDLFMVLDWIARRLHVGLPQSGKMFKVLRQLFERCCRPIDWAICKTVGHSELVVVAGLAGPGDSGAAEQRSHAP